MESTTAGNKPKDLEMSAGADVADSPAEAPPAVSAVLSEEVKAQESPNGSETSGGSRCAVSRSAI